MGRMSDLHISQSEDRAAAAEAKLAEVVAAVRDYHYSLDTGGENWVALVNAIDRIQSAVLPWVPFAEKARRALEGGDWTVIGAGQVTPPADDPAEDGVEF